MSEEYDIKAIHDDPLPDPPPGCPECGHGYGLMICAKCGHQFPMPAPHGYEIFSGEWDDESW